MAQEKNQKRKSPASSLEKTDTSLEKKARAPKDYRFSFFSRPSDVQKSTLEFSTGKDWVVFSTTSKQAQALEKKWVDWPKQIKKEWNVDVPSSKYLLKYSTIYHQLQVRNKLNKKKPPPIDNPDHINNPALFQSKLSKSQQKALPLRDCLAQATLVGNLPLIKWLVADEKGPKLDPNEANCTKSAIKNGDLQVLQWLVEEAPITRRLLIEDYSYGEAASYGHLQIVKWMKNVSRVNRVERADADALKWATHTGQLSVVKWLIEGEDGPHVTPFRHLIKGAYSSGNRELVAWLESPDRGQERLQGTPSDHALLKAIADSSINTF